MLPRGHSVFGNGVLMWGTLGSSFLWKASHCSRREQAADLHGDPLSFLPAGRAPTPLLEWPDRRGWGVPGITEC